MEEKGKEKTGRKKGREKKGRNLLARARNLILFSRGEWYIQLLIN